jgi:hypothetical protein
MQRAARGLQLLPAARQVDGVVAVPSIGRALTRAHEPVSAQLTQVVRHQALPLAEELCQLPHGPVAVHELPQQPPTNRVCRQPQEPGCIIGRPRGAGGAFHDHHRTQTNPVRSIPIDAFREAALSVRSESSVPFACHRGSRFSVRADCGAPASIPRPATSVSGSRTDVADRLVGALRRQASRAWSGGVIVKAV